MTELYERYHTRRHRTHQNFILVLGRIFLPMFDHAIKCCAGPEEGSAGILVLKLHVLVARGAQDNLKAPRPSSGGWLRPTGLS